MTVPAYSSFTQWYGEGQEASYVRTMKSPGRILDLLETARPAGDMHRPALPDLVLYQDLLGGSRLRGDTGGGYVDVTSEKGALYLAAPNFALTSIVDTSHQIRALSFPLAQWQKMLDEAADGLFIVRILATLQRVISLAEPSRQRSGSCGLCLTRRGPRRVCWRRPQAARFWPNCAG